MPIDKWINFNETGESPTASEHPELVKQTMVGHRKLVGDILSRRLELPAEVPYISKHEFWSSLEEYDNDVERSQTLEESQK